MREFRFLAAAEVTLLSDRRRRGPWGLGGGADGEPGKNILIRQGRKSELPGKSRFEVVSGDVLKIETPRGRRVGLTWSGPLAGEPAFEQAYPGLLWKILRPYPIFFGKS